MKVDGSPIDEYIFRPSIINVSYTIQYELEQARIYAGLTAAEFDRMPGTPMWCTEVTGWRSKCHILLLFRMSRTIPAVAEDASAKDMERKYKRH